ncbi:hypothetical protein BDV36DRAFT_249799 [Aspergillus pseudocaelatus]|uniref:Uncharacterized protein n=1 Tax=Aspergillus pseudocaelatus TaxID=1825620 RepID=A0ABQ6WTG3_9EURO|nr:hypothetical protein BDV36DRAFT_249799 [Aspergillus pseudocaelatus]
MIFSMASRSELRIKPDKPLIRVKPNINDIKLSDEFELALTDVSNVSMQANFITRYPDLAPYIRADIRSLASFLPTSPAVLLPSPVPRPSQSAANQALVPGTFATVFMSF